MYWTEIGRHSCALRFLLYTLQIHLHSFMMHLSPEACACGLLPCLRVLSTPQCYVQLSYTMYTSTAASVCPELLHSWLTMPRVQAKPCCGFWVCHAHGPLSFPQEPLLWPWACINPSQR